MILMEGASLKEQKKTHLKTEDLLSKTEASSEGLTKNLWGKYERKRSNKSNI